MKGAQAIEIWPVDRLLPYEKNARTHSASQVTKIADSIREFGFTNPILVDTRSGIIAGHGRLAAAREVGLADVPVIVLDYLSERQKRAYILADNRLALDAGWDEKILAEELAALQAEGFDLELTGFSDEELADLLPDPETLEPKTDDDEVPEALPSPKVVRGEVYILGKHRLMCGDSTVLTDVERLMNGEKADMVFSDPPYGMGLKTEYGSSMKGTLLNLKKRDYRPIYGDDQEFKFLDVYALVENVQEHFWWGADYYCDKLPKGGSWIVWDKKTTDSFQKMFGSDFELCWSRKKHEREIARVTWCGPFGHNKRDDGKSKTHPTMKPVKLIEWFFDRFKGHRVIDLFGGSGSTLIACEKTARNCFMMEIDPHYCGVILDRWQNFTGKKAYREDGKSWDEIKLA